jgi:ISXO2-like transposase domain
MAIVRDASSNQLCGFIEQTIEPGSMVRSDGWQGYRDVIHRGYKHDRVIQQNNLQSPVELLPAVHLVVSLAKRWLLGTHQGAVSVETSAILPGRIHLPFQPTKIQIARQTLRPLGRTSCGDRTYPPTKNSLPKNNEKAHDLSHVHTYFVRIRSSNRRILTNSATRLTCAKAD